jgi:hypothetical protein
MVRERTPYKEIDPPVRNLVRVLNRFPGLHPYSSCGGHAKPDPKNTSQCPKGIWYVDFHVDRTDEGWMSLEFMAWVHYDFYAPSSSVFLTALAKSPWNYPGEMLFFRWEGHDPRSRKGTADAVAEQIAFLKRDGAYITAARAASWPGD